MDRKKNNRRKALLKLEKEKFFRNMGSFVFKSKAPDCHEGKVKLFTAAGAWRGTEKEWAGAGEADWCELDKS